VKKLLGFLGRAWHCPLSCTTQRQNTKPNTKMKMNSQQKASAAYLESYARAMKALKDVENMIHDNPAPEGEVEIHWGHVGDMLRIASALEDILPED
jgi:hypothetical protein